MKLFNKIADLSNRTGPLAHLTDRLLSRVAPQQTAQALVSCTPWELVGCCSGARQKYRRLCLRGVLKARTEYACGAPGTSCV